MVLNKYEKFLNEKKMSLNQPVTEKKEDTGGKKRVYVPYFNPNKMAKEFKEFKVRILPSDTEMFFIQFKKHSFKVGNSWKNAFCFYTYNSAGHPAGAKCPFCDFISENKENLSKNTIYTLSAKNSHVMLVFNYKTNELQKLEVNDYGITDILAALQSYEDDINVDKEGFNLHYKINNKGYAEISGVSVPEPDEDIESLIKKCKNYKNIPNLEKEIIPDFIPIVTNSISSLLDLAINAFEPTAINLKENDEENKETEYAGTTNKKDEFDPNSLDEAPVTVNNNKSTDKAEDEDEKDLSFTEAVVGVEDEEDEENSGLSEPEDVEGIRDFLLKRKKKIDEE